MMWDDYYEPSEFDEAIEEFKRTIRDNVRDEIKNEITRLKTKISELQDVQRRWDELKKEHDQKMREMNRAIDNAARDARKLRMMEILDDFQQEYWGIENVGIEQPKCDKCDKYRFIHFLSPSGKDCTEECECRLRKPYYAPRKIECVEIDFRNGKMKGWYVPHPKDDYYTSSAPRDDKVYRGEPFEQIKKGEWSFSYPWFKTVEEAQAYCDWLNLKQEAS